MADTPERKVKKKVIEILKEKDAYYSMPVASGFGNSGVPDILVCYGGTFFGMLIDEGNVQELGQYLHWRISNAG